MSQVYLPTRKIVLVSGFEETLTDRSSRTAYCALRAYKTLLEENRVSGTGFIKSKLDMEKFCGEKMADASFVRAFIQLSRIALDVSDYVPLCMTIDYGMSIVAEYLKDTKNPSHVEFFTRKLREVRQKHSQADHLGGNYYMYEEMLFDSSRWLTLSEPYLNIIGQLRQLRELYVVDSVRHGHRNAYELYFLNEEKKGSDYRAFNYAKSLAAKSILKPSDVGEAKLSRPADAMQMLFIKEHLIYCSDFGCATDEPAELLRRLAQIAAAEKVVPEQVWLLSSGFIDRKGLLRAAGFTNQFFITCDTTNAFLKDATNKGMILVQRGGLAERIDYEAKRMKF